MHIIARMNVGGPAVEITELMRGLDPDIVSQRLVTGYCNDDEADFLENQAPDISATRINGLGRSIKATDDAKALAMLVRIIRASRPDIVHTHTAKAGVLGRIAAKAADTGAKIIHTHHGHLLHGYFGPTKTKAVIQVERQLAKITDRIITVGDKVRDDLLEACIGSSQQYTVIRSGVELGPIPGKQAAKQELGLPDGPVIASMIGRLTQIKRPDRFADIVEITKGRGLNVHYLVAGGGDKEPALRKRVVQSRLPVTMLGWRSDLERILAATDILLLTSDSEGAPLSLIQAAVAGIPSVTTQVGSVPEVVLDGKSGLVCSPDPRAMARAVAMLVNNPSLRSELGAAARVIVGGGYSMARFLSMHSNTYTAVQTLGTSRVGSGRPERLN